MLTEMLLTSKLVYNNNASEHVLEGGKGTVEKRLEGKRKEEETERKYNT